MKTLSRLLCFCTLGLTATAPFVRAQAVPDYVDYQGTVFDNTGKPLGSTGTAPNFTAEPRNYTMQFRIWNTVSGGATPIWAETQTVTVSLGTFSVRLGSGAAISGLPTGPISNAFAVKDRYLGVTVIFPPATTGTEITPRLAFQSSPFAFVAKSVDGVVRAATGSTFAAGIINGTALASATVPGTALADSSITTAKFTPGSVGSIQILDGSIGAADMAGSLGFWNRSGSNLYWNTGNVGIGTISPLTNLHVVGTTGVDHIKLDAGPGTAGAFLTLDASGITNGRYHRIFSTGGTAGEGPGKLVFQDSFAGGGNIMTLATNKVGIGTVTPTATLDVRGDVKMGAAGNYFATGSEENLRIIRGTVKIAGAVGADVKVSGSGFSATKRSAAVVDITFNAAFSAAPTVTTSNTGYNWFSYALTAPNVASSATSYPTAGGFRATSIDANSDTISDSGTFSFIAVGPR